MKFRITPGDWKVQLSDQPGYRDVINRDGTILAICCGVEGIDEVANADAIAAVPKMLALLVKCRDWCDHYSDGAHRLLCHEIDSLLKELGGEE